jgi:hypothetical protein
MRIQIHPEEIEAARCGIRRSPEWHRVEQLHLRMERYCVCCAETHPETPVQVHHIFPFHICIVLGRPDLELDQRNLITLCQSEAGRPGENHHLLVGHLDDFQSSNLDVERDATRLYRGMTAAQLRASVCWQAAVGKRLKPLGQMSGAEKLAFASLMNARLPKR